MTRNRLVVISAIVVLLLFVAGPSLVSYVTDYWWYQELGYPAIFLTMIGAQAQLLVVVTILALVFLLPNVLFAVNVMGEGRPVRTTHEETPLRLPGRQQLRIIAVTGTAVVSVLAGLVAASEWMTWLSWRNAIPFGQVDPILGHDVAFYVFSMPFLQLVRGVGQGLVVLAALTAGALYLASGDLTTGLPARITISERPHRHLAILAALFLLIFAFGSWLGRADYLLAQSDLIHGAAYADVHGRMMAALILTSVAVAASLLCGYAALSGRTWPIVAGVALCVVTSIGGEIYSSALQRFFVQPNEQVREEPYIQHNIDATRRAFAIDAVETQNLTGDADLSLANVAANRATLDNVRLWDHGPLLDTFGQIQEIRTYYDFVAVDNDRYIIDGVLRQVMLSARELNADALPNKTWVNERLTFTHGYGLTLGPVNQVTQEGLPVLFIRNLPPEVSGGLTVTEPSIYFGQLSNDYVIAPTLTKEFHYPKGDENVFTEYSGSGGIPIGSLWRKLLFAIRFNSYQILLSDDITDRSRILINRNIGDRVRLLAPFLSFDSDPYLVLADGRLFWMYDAYTTTSRYPYATRAGSHINYIRNAVKMTIDAYNGTVTMYLADAKDPIAATFANAFPTAFRPLAEMPETLRAHVRYPEDFFAIQASVYATYHMTQPAVFYNREDQWEVPSTDEAREASPMSPYYTIMKLPGEQTPEFIQMLPFTPSRKDNLAAWLVARSDGEHYGTLRVFQFPKQKMVFGPRQVVARMNQDQTISPQVTLWNQQGSQVIWGTLMVIPIEESLIYVRPLYLRGEGGRIPELRRVIVAHGNQIAMEDTLDAALGKLFGDGGEPSVGGLTNISATPQPSDGTIRQASPPIEAGAITTLAVQASTHFERAAEAQRSGNWAKYGEEIKALGTVLEQMHGR
jgi:uncharacterized membrane protein (UPF0182 family)